MARWGKWLLVVALVLLISGCGGASSDSSSGAAGDQTPSATFTPVKIIPTDTPVPPPPTLAPRPSPTLAPTSIGVATPEQEAETATQTETEAEPEAEAQPETEVEVMEESGMVAIPSGEFVMGSGQGDEEPAHTVVVDAFEIDIFEVTNAQFAQFVEETGYQTDAEKSNDPSPWSAYYQDGKEGYPVVKVSWNDAKAYCEWTGRRLPTEAEWEKAARGTDERIYPWGNEWDVAKVNGKESGFRGPVTVGSFPEGDSPFGLKDTAGNVWEWTDSWYQGYPQTTFNSNYFGETYKVLRGGGWFSEQEQVRTTKRNANSPDAANDDIGFRCAR